MHPISYLQLCGCGFVHFAHRHFQISLSATKYQNHTNEEPCPPSFLTKSISHCSRRETIVNTHSALCIQSFWVFLSLPRIQCGNSVMAPMYFQPPKTKRRCLNLTVNHILRAISHASYTSAFCQSLEVETNNPISASLELVLANHYSPTHSDKNSRPRKKIAGLREKPSHHYLDTTLHPSGCVQSPTTSNRSTSTNTGFRFSFRFFLNLNNNNIDCGDESFALMASVLNGWILGAKTSTNLWIFMDWIELNRLNSPIQ